MRVCASCALLRDTQRATPSLLNSLLKTSYLLLSLYNPGSVAACQVV
jgi:hypothetical protein